MPKTFGLFAFCRYIYFTYFFQKEKTYKSCRVETYLYINIKFQTYDITFWRSCEFILSKMSLFLDKHLHIIKLLDNIYMLAEYLNYLEIVLSLFLHTYLACPGCLFSLTKHSLFCWFICNRPILISNYIIKNSIVLIQKKNIL